MRAFIIAYFSLAFVAVAQNCGPSYGNQICAAGTCCSQYGWCDTSPAHCDPATCLRAFSGTGSSCADSGSSPSTLITSTTAATPTTFPSGVPMIDICGSAQGGVSCPGAGLAGYYYRCCSSAGHCGPKNDIQDQGIYCGAGCQAGFGKCDSQPKPADPPEAPGIAGGGETCGPLVNKRCAAGLCCSGSNFCGTGVDYCGAANWCQSKWGQCS